MKPQLKPQPIFNGRAVASIPPRREPVRDERKITVTKTSIVGQTTWKIKGIYDNPNVAGFLMEPIHELVDLDGSRVEGDLPFAENFLQFAVEFSPASGEMLRVRPCPARPGDDWFLRTKRLLRICTGNSITDSEALEKIRESVLAESGDSGKVTSSASDYIVIPANEDDADGEFAQTHAQIKIPPKIIRGKQAFPNPVKDWGIKIYSLL